MLSMLRNGDHRFMPLLLSKAHEVLPKVISPMLQNVPDSVAMNACNVDIFDGFGNGGMAQPPVMMDTYEKKYTPPDSNSSQGGDYVDSFGNGGMAQPPATMNTYEKKYTPPDCKSSQGGGSTSGNDMHSPFVSSPMSPAGELPSGLPNNVYNPISRVMMNQMGQPAAIQQVSAPNPPHTPHHHQPQTPMSPLPTLNPHMQNGLHTPIEQPPNLAQNFGQPFNQGLAYMNGMGQSMNMNGSNIMSRQVPNRASSFAMSPNPQLRVIGDFQALQRANSDISTMGSLGMNNSLQVAPVMDYGGMR